MIPAKFEYVRTDSAAAAIDALAEHGDEAKLLAGGHSLIPLMRLRLATPAVLVDIGPISDLSYVRDDGDDIAVGALTRHQDVETSELLRDQCGLLAYTTSQVGDPAVRHRGTIGGSVAHGDPASDLPTVLLALDATFVATGRNGERTIPASEFFTGFLETALADDELLTEIRVPKLAGAGWSYQKFNRRAQDWAIVGAAAVRDGTTRVALTHMAATPVRATAAEAALADGGSDADAAAHASDGLEPPDDVNASSEYRRHLASVMVARALAEAT